MTPDQLKVAMRPAWKRDAQTDADKMSLPTGKTCADCTHLSRCKALFGCNPANEVCDWSPHAFYPKELDR